jgi:hypothetical protein
VWKSHIDWVGKDEIIEVTVKGEPCKELKMMEKIQTND